MSTIIFSVETNRSTSVLGWFSPSGACKTTVVMWYTRLQHVHPSGIYIGGGYLIKKYWKRTGEGRHFQIKELTPGIQPNPTKEWASGIQMPLHATGVSSLFHGSLTIMRDSYHMPGEAIQWEIKASWAGMLATIYSYGKQTSKKSLLNLDELCNIIHFIYVKIWYLSLSG